MTREQALALLRDDVHALRFDDGGGYVYAQTLDNMVVLHGTNPALEGKPAPTNVTDAQGRPITELIRDAMRNSDGGVVSYSFPKPGQTQLEPKISYVARFAPWDLVFVAGAYVDDIDAAFHAMLFRLALIGGVVLFVTLLAAFLVNRDITGSLGALKTAMDRLAKANSPLRFLARTGKMKSAAWPLRCWYSRRTWLKLNGCGPRRRRSNVNQPPIRKLPCTKWQMVSRAR